LKRADTEPDQPNCGFGTKNNLTERNNRKATFLCEKTVLNRKRADTEPNMPDKKTNLKKAQL
jgi:hypothetical protein